MDASEELTISSTSSFLMVTLANSFSLKTKKMTVRTNKTSKFRKVQRARHV